MLKYFTLLQRCHVCGRTDETCKPCPYCNWWFCGQHLDPEQHDCMGLKIMGKPVDASKPEKQETLVPLVKQTSYSKSPAPVAEKAGESVLDENLVKGLGKLNKLLLIYAIGSPVGSMIAFTLAVSFASLSFGPSLPLLSMIMSLWPMLYGLGFTTLGVFLGALFMLILLAVGGGLMILFLQYGFLLPAFRSFRKHDESFGKPLLLVGAGCVGPLMLLTAIIAMLMGSASGKPVSNTPIMLFWIGVALLAVGQIGLVAGLLKLRRKLGNPRFSAAATMFILNLVLSLALSPLAAIAGLAGWILTDLATGSALKKTHR